MSNSRFDVIFTPYKVYLGWFFGVYNTHIPPRRYAPDAGHETGASEKSTTRDPKFSTIKSNTQRDIWRWDGWSDLPMNLLPSSLTSSHQCGIDAKLSVKQESCAIAKMTAHCALHMGALKIFETPWLRPGHYSQIFMRFCSDQPYECSYKIWSP